MSSRQNSNDKLIDLENRLSDCQDALQNLIFQKSLQQLEDVSQIRKMKKEISRIKTLIQEVASPKVK